MVEETKDTKVLNMEEKMADKVEKMQQFLADNKIECFDVQKLEDERHTTIFRSRMEVKGQLLPMAVLMDDSVYVILQVQIAPQVVDEAKLAELREETDGKPGGEEKIAEMEEIVQEMYDTYDDRINNNMLRFTDSRLLQWSTADAYKYDYVPVMGAGEDIYISRTQVTNEQYAQYINATGADTPENWVNGTYPSGEEQYPVNYVSYEDAKEYCAWLTENDENNAYRLPTESEWELAAGHMPKDADFNCGVNDGRTSVYQYENVTRGAHGAIDFWGNVWEWTSTQRESSDILGVKGGSWKSAKTDCRTEYRKKGRNKNNSSDWTECKFKGCADRKLCRHIFQVHYAVRRNPAVCG
mgnify:CR=1 FL=1